MKRISLIILSLAISGMAGASTKATKDPSNLGVVTESPEVRPLSDLGFFSEAQVNKLAENFKDEAKRHPSGSSLAGSEDLMSQDYKDFRNALLKARDGADFYSILTTYDADAKYNTLSNDAKYVVARMSTWIPFHSLIWRGTPLVHQTIVTQEMLLSTIRNMAEQVAINDGDSHLKAQMAFLSLPLADKSGILPTQFQHEDDVRNFFATDVYNSLARAIARLQDLKMVNVDKNGRETPIVFDAKIRFGEHAFNEAYDAVDRFKIIGESERFAAIARYHRRLANISQTAAYEWNGHLDLRRSIGRKFGVDTVKANGIFSMSSSAYIDGVTRKDRADVIHQARYAKLYTLTPDGGTWSERAYVHLHWSVVFLDKAWAFMKVNRDAGEYMQLDPEVFQARKDQIEEGLANMKLLTTAMGKKADGQATIQGAFSGEKLSVNVKDFFEHPPTDLKALYPSQFAGDEDVTPLKQKYPDLKATNGTVKMTVGNQAGVEWRNYFYGRATGWNPSAYSKLFPGVSKPEDVARAQRILNETRGARLLSMSTTMYVR